MESRVSNPWSRSLCRNVTPIVPSGLRRDCVCPCARSSASRFEAANIMVGSFGEVLVMDWGLAKILREHSLSREETLLTSGQEVNSESDSIQSTVITGHGTVMGTPGYMAPEQARGETERIDVRSDIFSLGALLRFVAVGGAQGKSVPQPRPLLAICAKATAESPNARYTHVSELAADVSLYLDGLRVRAYAENFLERFRRLHTDFY